MRIRTYGEAVLKKETKDEVEFGPKLAEIAEMMNEAMLSEKGLGLAAPQIGMEKRMFVIDMRQRCDQETPVNFTLDGKALPLDICMPLYAVNPELFEIDDYIEEGEEGCLSFPGIYAKLERMYRVGMRYQDLKGVKHELVCEGLFARCVQHEYDHLNGVSFVDRLAPKELFKIEAKLRKLKKQTKEKLKELA